MEASPIAPITTSTPSTSRSPPITLIDVATKCSSSEPFVEEPTRSIDPTKDQLLEKITKLENKLKESKDQSAFEQREIVISMLTHLIEKVDSKLNSIHSLYSFLFNLQGFDEDKEVEISLFTKWLQRENELRLMSMASKYHVERPPTFQPTYLLVKSMQESQIQPESIERKIGELTRSFNELNDTLLPRIFDENGVIKPLQLWKEESERIINTQVELICEDLDTDLLENGMDKIICTGTFFESFEREANQVVVKYAPYRVKADEVMSFRWPFDEEYNEWIKMYLNEE